MELLDPRDYVSEADTTVSSDPTVDITFTESQTQHLLRLIGQQPVEFAGVVDLYAILGQAVDNFKAWHDANDD